MISSVVGMRRAACRARRDDLALRHRSEHHRLGRPRPLRWAKGWPQPGQVAMGPFSVIGNLQKCATRCAGTCNARGDPGSPGPPPPARSRRAAGPRPAACPCPGGPAGTGRRAATGLCPPAVAALRAAGCRPAARAGLAVQTPRCRGVGPNVDSPGGRDGRGGPVVVAGGGPVGPVGSAGGPGGWGVAGVGGWWWGRRGRAGPGGCGAPGGPAGRGGLPGGGGLPGRGGVLRPGGLPRCTGL